jgi:hypothetical protein
MSSISSKKAIHPRHFYHIKSLYKPIALLPSDSLHHLDHLAPLCYFLNCPLITPCQKIYEEGIKYYKEVSFILSPFDLKSIAKDYNLIITSSKYSKIFLESFYEGLGATHMRYCFCPHGLSDKEDLASYSEGNQDLSLVYGRKQIHDYKAQENFFITGNYRRAYFERFKKFQMDKVHEIINFNANRPTILFAPTWDDNESETTFKLWRDIIEEEKNDYNIILKFHPLIFKSCAAEIYTALAHNQIRTNIRALEEYIPIYPLLEKTDIYLGDYSSIGYDFLYYNRPLFFLGLQKTLLQSAGIHVKNITEFFTYLKCEKTDIFSKKRKFLYDYGFSKYIFF